MEAPTELPPHQCSKILEAVFGVLQYWKRMLLLLAQLRLGMRLLDLAGCYFNLSIGIMAVHRGARCD